MYIKLIMVKAELNIRKRQVKRSHYLDAHDEHDGKVFGQFTSLVQVFHFS